MLGVFEGNHVEIMTHESGVFHRPASTGYNFVSYPSLELSKKRAPINEVAKHCILEEIESVPKKFLCVSFHVIEESFRPVLLGVIS